LRRRDERSGVIASLAGIAASLLLAAVAFARSRAAGGFYDAEVYAMTPQTHRRYAAIAVACAAAFATCLLPPFAPLLFWAGAAFTVLAVFYLTSYLRGAHEQDD
jgi:alkylation response protein AidB-like acyl-CoA dehydrogenase